MQLSVSKLSKFSARGLRQSVMITFGVHGDLISTNGTQSGLTAQMLAMENAYAFDGYSAGLYVDAALTQPTQHIIDTNLTIGGTRVINFEWVNGDGTQYITHRGYSITLQAEVPGIANILEFHESISIHGTGGPRVIVLESLTGTPQPQTVCLQTKVTATQSGRAVGMFAYIPLPQPIWPDAFKEDQATKSLDSPVRAANGLWQFPCTWNYQFESNQQLNGMPNQG